jgi:YfiH family protein
VIRPDWRAPARIRAAFTLRTGGVSVGPFASLNVGEHVGDAPDAVSENRRRVRQALALPAEPAWLEQVHGVGVTNLDAPREGKADASIARSARTVCAIQVADCMPVLFADREGTAVGAAHAGWRGLAGGVLDSTVRALGLPPQRLLAWLGPAIGPAGFEVGSDVRDAFTRDDPGAVSAFAPNARGKWQCDLVALARRRLQRLGVQDVTGGAWCTWSDPARFFSYRRDGQCGRMAALIWMEDTP